MLSESKDLAILAALGASNAPLLGEGGEARVYALGDHQSGGFCCLPISMRQARSATLGSNGISSAISARSVP